MWACYVLSLEAVKAIRPGEVTQPIRTAGGFYVLGLRGRRSVAQASMSSSGRSKIGRAHV